MIGPSCTTSASGKASNPIFLLYILYFWFLLDQCLKSLNLTCLSGVFVFCYSNQMRLAMLSWPVHSGATVLVHGDAFASFVLRV